MFPKPLLSALRASVQRRRNAESIDLKPLLVESEVLLESVAIDPVCGMTVDIATAKYMSEIDEELYYFCAAGCKTSFDKSPLNFIEAAAAGHSPEHTTS